MGKSFSIRINDMQLTFRVKLSYPLRWNVWQYIQSIAKYSQQWKRERERKRKRECVCVCAVLLKSTYNTLSDRYSHKRAVGV